MPRDESRSRLISSLLMESNLETLFSLSESTNEAAARRLSDASFFSSKKEPCAVRFDDSVKHAIDCLRGITALAFEDREPPLLLSAVHSSGNHHAAHGVLPTSIL